jgi:putative membrane protein
MRLEPVNDEELAGESRHELAEDRTDWAHERTLLAKERTFSAWVRTGLASIAAGIGVSRLLVALEPGWLVGVLGTLLVVMGAAALAFGFWSYRKTLAKLEQEGVRGIPGWALGLFTLVLMAGAAMALLLIWLN